MNGMKFTETCNYPVQGTAGDIANEVALRLDKALPNSLIIQHHDAFYLDVPESQAQRASEILIREMERPFKLPHGEVSFPVDPHIGVHWSDK